MPEFVKSVLVGDGHTVVVPRRPAEAWFGTGPAFMAPLRYKRHLLIDEAHWLHAWTVYRQVVEADAWLILPSDAPDLVFAITVQNHPSGWRFVIPPAIRRGGWLPKTGGRVIREVFEDVKEINIWLPEAFNIQAFRKATT